MAKRTGPDTYRVTHHTEECGCDHCGAPIFVGDTVVEEYPNEWGEAYCSRGCKNARR